VSSLSSRKDRRNSKTKRRAEVRKIAMDNPGEKRRSLDPRGGGGQRTSPRTNCTAGRGKTASHKKTSRGNDEAK